MAADETKLGQAALIPAKTNKKNWFEEMQLNLKELCLQFSAAERRIDRFLAAVGHN